LGRRGYNISHGASLHSPLDPIAKIIDNKRNAFKKCISARSIEHKIEYNRKKAIAKREVRRQIFFQFQPNPMVNKVLNYLNQVTRENIRIDVTDDNMWLAYSRTLGGYFASCSKKIFLFSHLGYGF
jgi:hypothetical protein